MISTPLCEQEGISMHIPLLGGRYLDVNSRIVAESIKLTLTL